MVNIKKFFVFFILIMCATVIFSYFHFKPDEMELNDVQKECLEKKIAKENNSYKDYKGKMKLKSASCIEIFGTEEKKDTVRVYGYETDCTVVVYDEKYYELCGGRGPFIADIKIKKFNNDYSNKLSLEKFQSVDEEQLKEKFPKKYRLKEKFFNGEELDAELTKKLEEKTGVKKDAMWLIEIDEENGTYKLFNIDENNETIVKEEGKLKKLK